MIPKSRQVPLFLTRSIVLDVIVQPLQPDPISVCRNTAARGFILTQTFYCMIWETVWLITARIFWPQEKNGEHNLYGDWVCFRKQQELLFIFMMAGQER